jgi:hypothetical protein
LPVGYSRKSLVQKLGIKPGFNLAILHAPDDYDKTLGELPKDVTITRELTGQLDLVQVFSGSVKALDEDFTRIRTALKQNGMVWISWPKSSSGVKSSLNENTVREIGLKNGLVDVKVCAIDNVWSGLKFVRRIKDR